MNDLAYERTTIRSYEDRYLRFRTKAGFAFRSEIGGVITNGWTTIEQAEWMASVAALSDDDLVLDIGAGRGWPGSLIAKETGAKLVSVDVPLEALRQGAKALREKLGSRVLQVCGDGRILPIGDAHFSAVCQADVLC
jgi:protein-L-isoaspartate O-methyltransferase